MGNFIVLRFCNLSSAFHFHFSIFSFWKIWYFKEPYISNGCDSSTISMSQIEFMCNIQIIQSFNGILNTFIKSYKNMHARMSIDRKKENEETFTFMTWTMKILWFLFEYWLLYSKAPLSCLIVFISNNEEVHLTQSNQACSSISRKRLDDWSWLVVVKLTPSVLLWSSLHAL